MDFSTLPQRKIKTRFKALLIKTGEEVVSFDKELEEMKKIQKQRIKEERSISDIADNINIAEEALYETLITNVELDAVLAIASKGFEILSVVPGKNSNSNVMFNKNGIDINLSISDHTRILMEETIKNPDITLKSEDVVDHRK